MKNITSLLRTAIFTMSIVSIFSACSALGTDEGNTLKYWHVSTIAGDGTQSYKDGKGTASQFLWPNGIAISPDGDALYVADTYSYRIRKITVPDGVVSTIAGDGTKSYKDGEGTASKFFAPKGIAISPDGDALYVADTHNNRIRKITIPDGEVSTIAGDGINLHKNGKGSMAQFNRPIGIVISPDGNALYVADTHNNCIRKIELSIPYTVTTIAGDGTQSYKDGEDSKAQFNRPIGIAISPDGNALYVADTANSRIRKITIPDGEVSTIAGDGTKSYKDGKGSKAQFNRPIGIAISPDGNALYVADTANSRIRKIELSMPYTVTTIAGDGTKSYKDGKGSKAQFNDLKGIVVAKDGTILYVVDEFNNRIRKLEYK